MHVVVIGGGAAGFFAALSVKEHHPKSEVTLIEKSAKLLGKVRVSGGGRCNVAHHCFENKKLSKHYPRGERFLRKAFEQFNVKDTIQWFASRDVKLKTEADGRMFPVTDDSNTIIECLMGAATKHSIAIRQQCAVLSCDPRTGSNELELKLSTGEAMIADRLIVATGGHPKPEAYQWLKDLGHSIIPPVPSLFTFNMPAEAIKELMGVVADPARVRIIGTDVEATGPLLITHWGMSGPAILRASAWGARKIHDLGYDFTLQVNWLGGMNEDEVRKRFLAEFERNAKKHIINADPFNLPKRLWQFLLSKADIQFEKRSSDLQKKERNRLIDLLTNDRYSVEGKTTFKEEFVTAGGVSLDDVDPNTMESKIVPNMYFAGEVLDIDGITGGFNFQAAWTTGHISGKLGQHR